MQERIQKILTSDILAMQLATISGNQPWICSVYFVVDKNLNIYWLSFPNRRHSQDIERNPVVAATIVVKATQPVIGLQLKGVVHKVADPTVVQAVMERYVAKYDIGRKFYDHFMAGSNQHVMYRLQPELFVLRDEVNLAHQDSVKWQPNKS